MNKLRLLLLCLSSVALAHSQTNPAAVNYVVNGNFETKIACPYAWNQIRFAKGWTQLDTTRQNGDTIGNWECAAEYCNTCAGDNIYAGVPQSGYFYQYPHSGQGMAQVYAYWNGDTSSGFYYLRDYIQNMLTHKLTAGKQYCVSFYVCLEESSSFAVKEIGAYFDNGAIDATKWCGLPQTQCQPQVVNSGSPIIDTQRWTKIEGNFIATGSEQFLTLGNFKDRSHTTTIAVPMNSYNYGNPGSYYLIDDVSVLESNTKADAGADVPVGQGDSVYIGRPTSEAIWCDWRMLGSNAIIGQGPGIWVKPAKTTYYEVTQTLCGTITKDTVKVEVWKLGVNNVNGAAQQYSLSPNPNNGSFRIEQLQKDDNPVRIIITNSLGQEVFNAEQGFAGKATMIDVPNLAQGVYHVLLEDSNGQCYTLKFVKQ